MKLQDKDILLFIDEWKSIEECIGILLCGSYAKGMATFKSDVDLRIILDNDKRNTNFVGTKRINETLVFYMGRREHDYYDMMHHGLMDNNKREIRNFRFGKVLYDKNGSINYLKKEANFLIKQNLVFLDLKTKKVLLYEIWHQYDKLKNLEKNSPFYLLNYYEFLNTSLRNYSKIIQSEIISTHKLEKFIFSADFRKKYGIDTYKDQIFIKLWVNCLYEISLCNCKKLIQYIIIECKEKTSIDEFHIKLN